MIAWSSDTVNGTCESQRLIVFVQTPSLQAACDTENMSYCIKLAYLIDVQLCQRTMYLLANPEFRRRGLGRSLMTASLVRAARNKMATVILEVDIENHRAIALYERLGFAKRRGSISHVWTVQSEYAH